MNLFYLDYDLDKCAEAHVSLHVGKLQTEAAQMMCTAIWIDEIFGYIPRKLNKEELAELRKVFSTDNRYKPTHPNHPTTVWVRTSLDNFAWTHCYANALYSEFYYRYGTLHRSTREVINKLPEPKNLPSKGQTPFILAMPDEYKVNCPVQSYRNYYIGDKSRLFDWGAHRTKPNWIEEV